MVVNVAVYVGVGFKVGVEIDSVVGCGVEIGSLA